jgi:hypothetical protein
MSCRGAVQALRRDGIYYNDEDSSPNQMKEGLTGSKHWRRHNHILQVCDGFYYIQGLAFGCLQVFRTHP